MADFTPYASNPGSSINIDVSSNPKNVRIRGRGKRNPNIVRIAWHIDVYGRSLITPIIIKKMTQLKIIETGEPTCSVNGVFRNEVARGLTNADGSHNGDGHPAIDTKQAWDTIRRAAVFAKQARGLTKVPLLLASKFRRQQTALDLLSGHRASLFYCLGSPKIAENFMINLLFRTSESYVEDPHFTILTKYFRDGVHVYRNGLCCIAACPQLQTDVKQKAIKPNNLCGIIKPLADIMASQKAIPGAAVIPKDLEKAFFGKCENRAPASGIDSEEFKTDWVFCSVISIWQGEMIISGIIGRMKV
ncbi:hypothetical protein GQR58_023338 [Nymphon striatum]|nr:hypothetical protein GQR58_023338 [Nymphon striatum]